jgi:hypothetical protein
MKRVNLSDLHEMFVLSDVLDQAIYLLSNSEVEYRASNLSRALGIHASVLTRMKLLHVNPQYEPAVNQYVLLKVLRFLFDIFPTLIIWRTTQGDIVVRLYKKFKGARLVKPHLDIADSILLKRTPPKPGTTRWYLAQP